MMTLWFPAELAPFTPGVGLIMDIRDFARSIKNIEKVSKLLSRVPVPAPVKFAAKKISDFLKVSHVRTGKHPKW